MLKLEERTLLLVMICFVSGQSEPYEVLQSVGGAFDIKHSASQVTLASAPNIVFVPGADKQDTPETSIIANRYICSEYGMAMSVQDPTKPKMLLIDLSKFGDDKKKKKRKCTVHWGDGNEDEVKVENDTTMVDHTYEDFGIYYVRMSCEDGGRCPESSSQCFTNSNFLDDAFSKFTTPIIYLSTEPILIKSYMEFANTSCTSPHINWRITMTHANNTLSSFTDFKQPNTSVLKVPQGALTPGYYVVSLEVAFPEINESMWADDSFVLQVVDPEIVAHISGGEFLYVPHGNEVLINAEQSHDPLNASDSSPPLLATWSFAYYSELSYKLLQTFMRNFPNDPLPVGGVNHVIGNGTDYILKVDTSLFPVETYGMAMFTLARGSRMASALRVIQMKGNVLPVTIDCVYNCHVGRDRLFYYDKVELDINVPDGTDTTYFTYTWSIQVWNTSAFSALSLASVVPYTTASGVILETGLNTASIGIKSASLVQGFTYRITAMVSGPAHQTSMAELIRAVNYVPFGGSCDLESGRSEVISARDWLTFSCTSWSRYENIVQKTVDSNPALTFVVRQRTAGAVVEEEPILQTRSQTSHVILKVGDPANYYATQLLIRITDMFNNYNEQVLNITANPAFNVDDVRPNTAGADLIRKYTEVDYPFDEQQLRDMGKSDMIISLVSAVCSNLHLIDFGVWKPPVPRVLNTDGFVMDLNAEGNKDVGDLDGVLADADNETVDVATIAIQDVMMKMIDLTRSVADLLNGTRSGDKMLASLITNSFTNLAARPQYVNYASMTNIIYIARRVGLDALFPQNITGDSAAQTESSSGEIFSMFQTIVQASVPDDFVEIRSVGNLLSGREQIKEMLSVTGQNISIDNSLLSPEERAFLYIQMQKKLKYYNQEKKNTSREAAYMAIELAQEVQNQLKICRMCSNNGSRTTGQLVAKGKIDSFVSEKTSLATSRFRIDGLNKTLENESSIFNTVSVSAFEFPENAFMYDDDGTSSFVTSKVLRIDIKSDEKRVTPGYMTFEQKVITPDPEHIHPTVDEEDASDFMYHKLIYQKSTDNICMIIEPTSPYSFTQYTVYIKFSAPPSIIDYDFTVNIKTVEKWQICIPPEKMDNYTGLTYMALSLPGNMRNVDYNLTIVTVGCLTWEEEATKWHTDKCQLEWKPKEDLVTCYCQEITDLVFSNTFFRAPNSIDFSSVFLKFSPLNQAAVIGTFSVMFISYFVAVIFLAGLDRRDTLKWGITPLRDNLITDKHYYIVKVFTGMRRGAGTRSRVAFILTGTKGDSRPRELFDGVRQGFSTGSIRSFFLATNKHLGDLLHLFIWHDNSGKGDEGWYLNQVVIYDIQTRLVYTFVAERWLSVETGVAAHLSSSLMSQPVKFESRFFYHIRDRLSQNHMWLSILYRPQTSTFTRVQRASCALAYIFLTMLANAMYFNPDSNYQSPAILQVGPFRFTKPQIFISIVCALITTPPIMLIVFLFQHTKKMPDCSRSACSSIQCQVYCSCTSRRQKQKLNDDLLKSKLLSSNVPEFKRGLQFPYWFVFFAWFVTITSIVVPAFFILLYSMEWGKQKSEEWLTTFFMSLFESMLFVDPVMVLCIVVILTLLVRSNQIDTSVDMDAVVRKYKQMIGEGDGHLSSSITILKSLKDDIRSFSLFPRQVTPPLDGQSLAVAAKKHRHDMVLSSIVKDIILNLFLIFIIFSICYANRDDRSYLHHSEIMNTIVEPWKMPQFHSINTPVDFYTWMNITVIPSLFPEFDVNGAPLHWTIRQFTTGYNNLRLGPPRLRQLRAKNNTCEIPYFGKLPCFGEYEILDDEDKNYCLGWSEPPCPESESAFNISSGAWKYQSAYDIWGLPTSGVYKTYGGGGYIATFDINRNMSRTLLNELFKNLWMDRQTRAVIFEYTVYNGATNLFIYNIFTVEFLQTGGAFTSYSVYPIRVYTHQGANGTFTLVCEIIFILYLILMFVKCCVRMYQQRLGFFKKIWQVYESVMLILGICIVVAFAIRLVLTFSTIKRFKKDKKLFVNFGHIMLWDQILVSFLAILVFMATLRMLEVFATSKKVRGILEVFDECGNDLFWYSMTFMHIFLAFCFLGMLVFGPVLISYKDIYKSMGTLFIALIGKSKFTEINETQPVFAKIFFTFYIVTVVFFVLTIFLAIMGASIDNVVHSSREDPREDLIEHIFKTIRAVIVKPTGRLDKETRSQENVKGEANTSPVLTPTSGVDTCLSINHDAELNSENSGEIPQSPTPEAEAEPEIDKSQLSLNVQAARVANQPASHRKPILKTKPKAKVKPPWKP